MIAVPIRKGSGYALLIMLEEDNVARMREHDPAEVAPAKLGAEWKDLTLELISMVCVTSDEAHRIVALVQAGRGFEALEIAVHGFTFRRDNDDPYRSIKT